MCFELQFGFLVYSKSVVQLYFRPDPQMTLGPNPIFRGQIVYGQVRPDPDESFGVIFSPVALLGGPQCAVQISIT